MKRSTELLNVLRPVLLAGRADTLSEAQLLAALLAYAKMEDAEEAAPRLLTRFGGIGGVLRASERDLQDAGATAHASLLLHTLLPVWSYARTEAFPNEYPLNRSSRIGAYLTRLFCGARVEAVYLLLLRADFTRISCERVAVGSINSTSFNYRAMAERALFANARYAVVAHNHPFGTPLPSREDVLATEQLRETFETVGISLLEHFVVAEQSVCPILYANHLPTEPGCPDFYDEKYPHITHNAH